MAVQTRRFVSPADVQTQVFDWGSIKWFIEVRTTGSTRVTGGLSILEAGKGHVRHKHPGSDEVLYFISGEGEQMVEDDDGTPMVRHVRAGDVIFIPQGIYHATDNTGWEPLRIFVVYAPGGPEAILRGRPDCRIVPPGEIPKR